MRDYKDRRRKHGSKGQMAAKRTSGAAAVRHAWFRYIAVSSFAVIGVALVNRPDRVGARYGRGRKTTVQRRQAQPGKRRRCIPRSGNASPPKRSSRRADDRTQLDSGRHTGDGSRDAQRAF